MKQTSKVLAASVAFLLAFALCGCGQASDEAATPEGGAGEADLTPPVDKPEIGEMVKIPAGEFTMGSDVKPGEPPLAAPAYKVDLPAYEIDVYEVTNGDFAKFQLESDYKPEGDWRASYSTERLDFPVANVTWNDAKEYCKWAGKRLPSEAEWEKAARGEKGLPYPWGEVFDWNKSNTNEHGVRNLVEVGTMEADRSSYGAYDTMGNVQEWTADILKPYPGSPVANHQAFSANLVATRGASYAMKGDSMFLWTRSGYPAKAQFGLGFRCAKDAQ